jgi:hypothetical protein
MGTPSRLLLLFLTSGGVAAAQQDPYAQGDPNAQYDPNAQPQYDPNAQQPQYDPNAQPQQYPPQQYPQQQYPQQQYPQQGYQQDPYAQQPADPYGQPQYEQQYEYAYMGAHPIPYDQGGGYCYQTVAHYHPYAPFDQYLFRESGGYHYFVGDPSDFGYTQQLWGYNGNHPIPASWGGGYCYITWGHRHPYPPPSTVYFNLVGGFYVYNGPWDPYYWRWRDRYFGYYGGYYRNNYYGGRYWTVRPPAIYRSTLRVGAPGVRVMGPRPGVVVGAPPARPYGYGGPVRTYGAPPARVVTPPPRRAYGAPPARVVAPPPARPYTPAPHIVAPPAARPAPAAPFRHR